MNGWIIAGAVAAVVVLPVMFVAWSLCKVASDADDYTEFDAELRALIETDRDG